MRFHGSYYLSSSVCLQCLTFDSQQGSILNLFNISRGVMNTLRMLKV